MVTRHTLILLVALAAIACNNTAENKPEELAETKANTVGVSAAELNKGTEVPLADITFDSLKLHLKKGDRLAYLVKMVTKMRQDSNQLDKDETILIHQHVTEVAANGDATIDTRYKSMNIKVKLQNAVTGEQIAENSFDSKDTADLKSPQTQQFAVMLDTPFFLTVTPQATVKNIAGVEAISRKVLANAPAGANVPKPSPEEMGQLTNMIRETLIAGYVATTMAPLPEGAMNKDGTWARTQTTQLNPAMSSVSTTTFSVKNVRNINGHRIATINGVVKGEIKLNAIPQGVQAPKIKLTTASIEGTSEVVLDLDTGVLISNKGNAVSVVDGTIGMPAGPARDIHQRQELVMDTQLQP
ncbi:MAG: hypothetical protein J5I53_08580 [Bradyrhizobiaceae bacterium]|nr:hypothetical protein [Bradyrhizobiaceae bacterium]